MPKNWQIWIDTGGTFTDCLATDPGGKISRLKILSSGVIRGKIIRQDSPTKLSVDITWPLAKDIFRGFSFRVVGLNYQASIQSVNFRNKQITLAKAIKGKIGGKTFEILSDEEVPVVAARLLTSTPIGKSFPTLEMKLGSTRGTNAILERKGARTAFVVTNGFRDLLLIGNQQRKELFALNVIKTDQLYAVVIEVDERIEASGEVIRNLSRSEVQRIATQLKKKKIESVAIALMNSYKNPKHERLLKESFIKAGFKFVSASHELSSQIKILQRSETTVANAYLDPIIQNYVQKIRQSLEGQNIKIMTSAGSLANANSFQPKDSLLSGPAGGVVGAATTAALSGVTKLIGFDMGGTSTDVSLYNKRYDYRFESEVGDHKIFSPSLAIQTIAAGGGSICGFDGYKFTVGPSSAGAVPGPACYGAGGPLTITDVNLLLGKIHSGNFAIPLNIGAAEAALDALLEKVHRLSGDRLRKESVLESLTQIANEKMAEAIRKVTVQYGHDPSDYTLLSFGGAGGQHACQLAEILGVSDILIPYDAGLLSAFGIGHAAIEKFRECLVLKPLREIGSKLPELCKKLYNEAVAELKADGFKEFALSKRLVYLRFKGQESTIEIEFDPKANLKHAFKKKYESIFGHWLTDREIEVESLRVAAKVLRKTSKTIKRKPKPYRPETREHSSYLSLGKYEAIKIFSWEKLKPGATVAGPAIVTSDNSTTFVEKGWGFSLDEHNNAQLSKKKKITTHLAGHSRQAQIELFTNRFTAVAQEMGALLQRTSFSVNVKERLDFSCALLDASGYLVVNAPHIPVHLGSLGVCVREVAKVMDLGPGDVAITNHPKFGGSHLPDITLIKAVFYNRKKIGYVANRAHHAEIGGKKPGSMPSDAVSLDEEGVIISPTYLVKAGKPQWENIKSIFTSAQYPTRLLEENLADLNGALAAVNYGEQSLRRLCDEFGIDQVKKYMVAIREYASAVLSDRLSRINVKALSADEELDDGSRLHVAVQLSKNRLVFDFNGTSKVHPGNLNATKAIVHSVILYVLRILVDKPIPMNEGLMARIKIILPECLLNPNFDGSQLPAVVGGNTEVSQRLTDTLLKAFHLAACSQGTMNNFLFGSEKFGYYETICGGTGAGPGFDGTDAVHQHMTNTRITDPEIMELRYPVRLEKFEIRKGSGGKGRWNGGEGITREILFKEKMEVSLLTQHRVVEPYGLEGGLPGKCGSQTLTRKNGSRKRLKGQDGVVVYPGDRITINTPGGGGYGKI